VPIQQRPRKHPKTIYVLCSVAWQGKTLLQLAEEVACCCSIKTYHHKKTYIAEAYE